MQANEESMANPNLKNAVMMWDEKFDDVRIEFQASIEKSEANIRELVSGQLTKLEANQMDTLSRDLVPGWLKVATASGSLTAARTECTDLPGSLKSGSIPAAEFA